MATTSISRTFSGTPTDTKKWTFSAWVKRCTSGVQQLLFEGYGDTANYDIIELGSSDQLKYKSVSSSSEAANQTTNRLFKDPAAWYHIVIAQDSTQASGGNRLKIYVNGTQITSLATDTQMSLNHANHMNVANEHNIGAGKGVTGDASIGGYFSGNMSHVQFVDGLQLAPTEFGEVDSTSGIWKIKTGAYATPGNNGFFLKMEDRTNLDLDSSSNANTFTTAGTLTATYDNPSDNFCTLNTLNSNHSGALTNGNTTGTTAADAVWRSTFSTIGAESGKFYWEGKCASEGAWTGIGVASIENMTAASGNSNFAHLSGGFAYQDDGVANNQSSESSYGDSYTTGDIIGVAFDATNGNMWFSKNGTWQNSATIAEIAAGTTTNAAFTGMASTTYLPTVKFYNGTTWSMNYGNGYFGTTAISSAGTNAAGIGEFEYDVPTGYSALSTKGLNL